MIPGLETLLFGAMKAAIVKGAVAGAAHAAPLALQHAAMHAAINVTGSALVAGGITHGAMVVGKGGKGVYDFVGKVEKYRSKHNISAEGQEMPSYLAVQPSSDETLLDDIYEVVMAQIAALGASMLEEDWDFEKEYKSLRHMDSTGYKIRLREIEECTTCPCDDFDLDIKGKMSTCRCGHGSYEHRKSENPYFFLVARTLASQVYEELRHCDARGRRKTKLTEMRPCGKSGGCPCVDFEQYDTGTERCMCGHGNRSHAAVQGTYSHLYVGVIAEFLYGKLENVNAAKNPKTSLFLIHPCDRCGCKDFNRWYGNRLTDNHVCKCDHGYRSHSYLLSSS